MEKSQYSILDKSLFVGLDKYTWLYSGAECPPYSGAIQAVHSYLERRSEGPCGREENARIEEECRENMATLLNGSAQHIAFLSSSSEAFSMLAQSIGLVPGDNIVIHDLEFPSGILPWLNYKDTGVDIRVVLHEEWEISTEQLLEQVDGRTRLVLTSHVSYLSGARIDYKALYRHLKHTSTLLVLDATQSLGVVPVDMNDADFVVCSSYKWLLGIHGSAVLAVNPARTERIMPRAAGWRSVDDQYTDIQAKSFRFYPDARRFQLGYPSYATIYALHHTSKMLQEIGIDRIERHILKLGEWLITSLAGMGHEVMTHSDGDKRAGNICIATPHSEEMADYLRGQDIYVMGGNGRLRASIHLFNDMEDLQRLVAGLKKWELEGHKH